MSKVLYIGNYKENTGWGNAVVNNILAIDSAGIDVVPRAVAYELKDDAPYPDRIKQLEANSSYDCDICIQHVLPHLFSYNSNYKNIGFMAVESALFRRTGWVESANLMDEIWVPSLVTKAHCRLSGIKVPIKVVPHSLNLNQFNEENVIKVEQLESTFNFIFIGEFIERKNIAAFIKAFYTEFDNFEPVNLVIKTSQTTASNVETYVSNIANGLKIRKKYKPPIVISGMINRKIYTSILKQCHSFVMPSRGEAFCIPALEAMACGIPIIWTENTGLDDFAIGEKVQSYETPCFGAVTGIPFLDNSRSYWQEIDLRKLQFAMRSAFMKWNTEQSIKESKEAKEKAKEYTHESIGKQIKELLNDR